MPIQESHVIAKEMEDQLLEMFLMTTKHFLNLGVGLDYGFNTHLSIGPTVRVMQTRKENVRIPNVTFGLETKYNFLANDKKVSPFIVSEVSMTNLVIRQEEVTEEEIVNTKNGNEPLKQINVTTTPVSETKIGSILGVTLGIGSDFTVKQKYGVFVSFNYMFTNAHEHAKLQEVYPENTSKYSFFLIKAGMNFGFLRSNKI